MKWKQFFTPVTSVSSPQAKEMIEKDGDNITLLDVRQPQEYKASHLPGALLIPLGELDQRLAELDPNKPIIVY